MGGESAHENAVDHRVSLQRRAGRLDNGILRARREPLLVAMSRTNCAVR